MSDTFLVLASAGFIVTLFVGYVIDRMVSHYQLAKLYYELNKAHYIANIQAPTTAELNAGTVVDDTPGQAGD